MTLHRLVDTNIPTGKGMHALVKDLYPICRSITGNGVRQSLHILQERIPLEIHEVPTGTKVFDWEVPKEWNISNAYIKGPDGREIVNFRDSNLHVLNYSIPVHKKVSLAELKEHLHYMPEHPDWIPYRTSYYKPDWGFCITYNQFLSLTEGEYEVCIDSSLEDGSLTYGELYIPGHTDEEILISAHICHPSLANDNLSGISVSVFLAQQMMNLERRFSYRFLFMPGTIGAITWLALNKDRVHLVKHGLVLSLLGDSGNFNYKKSRRDTSEIDLVAAHVLENMKGLNKILDFIPYGYDERQYCSPGFNLPVGCLSRTPYGQYPEYHTSADNLDLVKPDSLEESLGVCIKILDTLEANHKYVNLSPMCEPQLGKRGLYNLKGGNNNTKDFQMAMLWVLNLSDGNHTLLDIQSRSKMNFYDLKNAADALVNASLLKKIN